MLLAWSLEEYLQLMLLPFFCLLLSLIEFLELLRCALFDFLVDSLNALFYFLFLHSMGFCLLSHGVEELTLRE